MFRKDFGIFLEKYRKWSPPRTGLLDFDVFLWKAIIQNVMVLHQLLPPERTGEKWCNRTQYYVFQCWVYIVINEYSSDSVISCWLKRCLFCKRNASIAHRNIFSTSKEFFGIVLQICSGKDVLVKCTKTVFSSSLLTHM